MKIRNSLKFRFLYTALTLSLVLTACSGDDDEAVKDLIKPTGTITMPLEGETFLRGSSIIFEGTFSDDVELAHCELSLSKLKSLKGWDIPWTPESDLVHLQGTEDEVSAYQAFKQVIPSDIMSGDYVLNAKLVDEAGNYIVYSVNVKIY
ncbi:DUF4625 domain-containing protein [Carboxylicivirga sp. RSCT41]|uniref:DUF4625 domain-containing protein n=1 Tax=Carboxylicivirga agarovorans TaxID=3417570 RepID=UPI003D33A530